MDMKEPIYDKNEVRYGLTSPELGKFHPSREQTMLPLGTLYSGLVRGRTPFMGSAKFVLAR